MQKNTIIIALVTLIAGGGIGYSIGMHSMIQNSDMHQMQMPTMDMTEMIKSMNIALEGKMGDDFDKTFLSEMIVHHQGAVDMAQAAMTNAKHGEIKTLAQTIIDTQTKEIAEMKEWQSNWYGVK